MNRINALQWIKKVYCRSRSLFSLFIALTLLLSLGGCRSIQPPTPTEKYALTSEERLWLKEFFHDILFEDPGAYVLYGTKPMSWTGLFKRPTEEEIAHFKKAFATMDDDQKSVYIDKKRDICSFYEHFEKWQSLQDRFPITQYLFAVFPARFDSNDCESLFFVNIEILTRTLLANYEDFKRITGQDFEPLLMVFELENKNSAFWNKAFGSHLLLGILLGFGRDNAYFYNWERLYGENPNKIGLFLKNLPCAVYDKKEIIDPDCRHFNLPTFSSYGLYPNDKELIARYREEQKFIKKLYSENDEVDIALKWLTR